MYAVFGHVRSKTVTLEDQHLTAGAILFHFRRWPHDEYRNRDVGGNIFATTIDEWTAGSRREGQRCTQLGSITVNISPCIVMPSDVSKDTARETGVSPAIELDG